MKIEVRNQCADYSSYRAARVKSLFNVDSGANFSLDANMDIDDGDWQIGLIVGPSGSGKTSIGRQLFGGGHIYEPGDSWPKDKPIIDVIAGDGDFDAVTGALSAVGLGSVPSWLRPYHVLSNGEKFRSDLARLISEAPDQVIVDEFTSVVDRQVAKIGAAAFGKAWRRTGKKCVLLSCHYDVIDWLEPDWVFDTAERSFARGSLWQRPKFELEIVRTDWRYWPEFEPHHYLKIPKMIGACCYVGVVNGERVAHIAVACKNKGKAVEARACRMVIKPEWQGAGVGMKFLNAVCEAQKQGSPLARLPGRNVTTIFHTSHPGLAAALRRDRRWHQVSANLHGGNKAKSAASMKKTSNLGMGSGFGGHMRAVQGFRYYGEVSKA
jgi:ABC-type ATPase with predicted acetyltransferase domain